MTSKADATVPERTYLAMNNTLMSTRTELLHELHQSGGSRVFVDINKFLRNGAVDYYVAAVFARSEKMSRVTIQSEFPF